MKQHHLLEGQGKGHGQGGKRDFSTVTAAIRLVVLSSNRHRLHRHQTWLLLLLLLTVQQ